MRNDISRPYPDRGRSSGHSRISTPIWAALCVLLLSACAVGPDYIPPDTQTAANWHTALQGGLTDKEMAPATLARWWTALDDPVLSALIDRAVKGNLGLKQARGRVRAARAKRGIAQADLFPTLNGNGATKWTRTETEGDVTNRELYSAGFDASWELDIFGGTRRSVEAAEADLQASQEDLHDVLVSLMAELARNYIEARTYQERLFVAEANLKAQSETKDMTESRYQAGLSDELAAQQARYNLESTRSQIPTLRTGLEEAMNRIAVLLGEQPGAVHEVLKEKKPIPVIPVEVAVGVPADVIRRRPDVRKAERELAAQTARIGVAMADLYPKFTLSGSIGLESLVLNGLTPAKTFSLLGGPAITWNIFNAGAVRKNIEVQNALQEQYMAAYESSVLGALEEVENALVAYAQEQLRRENLRQATEAARKAAELAAQKYQAGLTDFSAVLDAQRSMLSFEDSLASSEGNVVSNLISLYKALGGGWTSMAAAPDPAAAGKDNAGN